MNTNINKNEIVARVASQADFTKKDTECIIDAFIDVIKDTLCDGDKIKISGFGTFEVRERAARVGQNPHTGEPVQIEATKAPAFKAGKTFKEAIKNA